MLRSEARIAPEWRGTPAAVWIYEIMMSLVRSARDEAARAFVARDVRAAAVRAVLNRLGPFYDPDFVTLPPHPHIQPGATR